MTHQPRLHFAAALIAALLTSMSLAAQTLEPGYSATATTLPNGTSLNLKLVDLRADVRFDGTSVVFDDGRSTSTLLTFPAFTFGSFLVRTSASTVLFGESSQGDLYLLPLNGGAPRVLARLPLNYDAVLWNAGAVLVSAKTGGFSSPLTEIWHVDLGSGALDKLAELPGASGPLDLDRGGIVYATASLAFPTPPGTVEILSFDNRQLQGALGPTHLLYSDARVIYRGLDAASDLAVDGDEDVFFVDWMNGTVGELSRTGRMPPRVSVLLDYAGATFSAGSLQYVGSNNPMTIFEPFQPQFGLRLLVTESNFGTGAARSNSIEVAPAVLSSTPSGPIPLGRFTLEVAGAAPNGFAVLAFGIQTVLGERLIGVPGFEGPILWSDSLLHGSLESIGIPLDAQGRAQVALANPGVGPLLAFVAQAAFVDANTLVLGATAPLRLRLL
ncbi:MAG: hypothetical protein AB7I19_10025 [Planctomycetota bacterium]